MSFPTKVMNTGLSAVCGVIALGLAAYSFPQSNMGLARAEEPATPSVFVAAASSLRFALEELSSKYFDKTGVVVNVSYGSSGNLTRQILHGAPFEIFLSADDIYTQRLIEDGAAQGPATTYAIGRIGIFISDSSRLATPTDFGELIIKMRRNGNLSFAIANPEHAPYGRAARECLKSLKLLRILKAHLILGENATQATQFAASGQIDGGIIPRSLSKIPEIDMRGSFHLLPDTCHTPLRQSMVLTDKAGKEARALFVFLYSQMSRDTLRSFGFDVPDQE